MAASIVHVKEQMDHSSIRVTVDIYGPLIPGANVSFVDRLDQVPEEPPKTTPPQNATQAQLPENRECEIPAELIDLIGGGGRTRTYDLRIMSPETPVADKEDKGLSSAESCKVLQNPQPTRNKTERGKA